MHFVFLRTRLQTNQNLINSNWHCSICPPLTLEKKTYCVDVLITSSMHTSLLLQLNLKWLQMNTNILYFRKTTIRWTWFHWSNWKGCGLKKKSSRFLVCMVHKTQPWLCRTLSATRIWKRKSFFVFFQLPSRNVLDATKQTSKD